ncbi:MAG: hypothetical protein HFF51_10765, partial [Lawsonibacter sp.]|nr:hypothetical protein [Lawsonibacter sp.]
VELNEARKELVHRKMEELEETGNEDGKYKQPFGDEGKFDEITATARAYVAALRG